MYQTTKTYAMVKKDKHDIFFYCSQIIFTDLKTRIISWLLQDYLTKSLSEAAEQQTLKKVCFA